ncbi:MAG: type III-B CRISPR module-associated protein Cmr3, partial [Deltaproteobacteria bacterium]|nr:type III-B CRISPR module-associated protein Cmr3 [Deltaproteobacteria bacterium]
MLVFIRPLDTQFHRGGLPFDAGEDTEADSFFPPFPRTLYGAFRAAGMLRSGGCLDFKSFRPGDEKV